MKIKINKKIIKYFMESKKSLYTSLYMDSDNQNGKKENQNSYIPDNNQTP